MAAYTGALPGKGGKLGGLMVGGGGTSSGESKKANAASNKKKIAAFKAGKLVE